MIRRPALLLALVALATAGALSTSPVQGVRAAGYVAPSCALAAPPSGQASAPCVWQGATLHSPTDQGSVAGPTTPAACSPSTVGDCEDTKITVPAGLSLATLYVKVSWQHPAWQAYLYVIDPSGTLKGTGGFGCDVSSYEKGCGNQTTLQFDELAVINPAAGVWTVRVAAVNIHNEAYTGEAVLTHSGALEYAAESLDQLTAHLTRTQRVNVVFAGWKPTTDELAQLRANLTSEFRPSVAEKQSADGGDANDGQASGLVQHETSHFTATDNPGDSAYNAAGAVPYFEPLRFVMDYHFLAADDTWTKDLFGAMKAATTKNHALAENRIPETTQPFPFEGTYLAKYNATDAAVYGGPSVTDTMNVDEVDGPTVEDWIQNTRLNAKYRASFTNLQTGAKEGAAFINPDPNAVRDPFWNGNGRTAVNLDRDPQGNNTGITFFLLDTFSPSYASDYFSTDHYHAWWTANHVTDPDTGEQAFQDNGRGWGGRYRFSLLDLGAAPSTYERANWVSTTVAPDAGSAAFDPPIWDYRNNPQWNGSQSVGPLQAGGNTLGEVMGWELTQAITFKYIGAYLYRPIPNDVYVEAVSQLTDHYSLPATQGGQDLYSVDMNKVDNPRLALGQLSTAAPYDTFLPGPQQTRALGCAANRIVGVGNANYLTTAGQQVGLMIPEAPDPSCSAQTSDGMQQAIEDAKAHGTGELATVDGQSVIDYAIDVNYLRDYVDEHRAQFAPLYQGAFTIPVLNIMFEKTWNVALPMLAGGISSPANAGEGWGQIDNVNDNLVPLRAIDCANSVPGAPGCTSPVPDVLRHNYGLTYVMIHESSHFLGLPHPHDGTNSVGKAGNGKWQYYYSMLKWLYDVSASPTTYAGDYSVYETIDQERLMYGHAAEYLRQAQDAIKDAYFQDAMAGRVSPSAPTLRRLASMRSDIALGSALFKRGDYLHSMYAMRNAALHAKGVTQAPVAPHRMSLSEAATSTNAIFAIDPTAMYDPDLSAASTGSTTVVVGPTSSDNGTVGLVNTAAPAEVTGGLDALLALVTLAGVALFGTRRRRTEA